MEARYGIAQRIWVMDRGMTSEGNLEWLRETGRRYRVGTPKSELKKWAGAIAEARDWQTVRDGIEAKQCVGPDGIETFVRLDQATAGIPIIMITSRTAEKHRRHAAELGVDGEDTDALDVAMTLDAEAEAVLVPLGPPPSVADIVARYNRALLAALLRASERITVTVHAPDGALVRGMPVTLRVATPWSGS